jgi:hypothetical protein
VLVSRARGRLVPVLIKPNATTQLFVEGLDLGRAARMEAVASRCTVEADAKVSFAFPLRVPLSARAGCEASTIQRCHIQQLAGDVFSAPHTAPRSQSCPQCPRTAECSDSSRALDSMLQALRHAAGSARKSSRSCLVVPAMPGSSRIARSTSSAGQSAPVIPPRGDSSLESISSSSCCRFIRRQAIVALSARSSHPSRVSPSLRSSSASVSGCRCRSFTSL